MRNICYVIMMGLFWNCGSESVSEEFNKDQELVGSIVEYGDTGIATRITSYVDGKKSGIDVVLDEFGNIKEQYHYQNDLLNGKYIRLDGSSVMEETDYVNGVKEGEEIFRNRIGDLMMVQQYTSGELKLSTVYSGGEPHYTYTYENGSIVATDTIK